MAKKTGNLTVEQQVEAWLSNPNRVPVAYARLVGELGWEPGQMGHITMDEMNYETLPLPEGGFAVIEWDEHGNVCAM